MSDETNPIVKIYQGESKPSIYININDVIDFNDNGFSINKDRLKKAVETESKKEALATKIKYKSYPLDELFPEEKNNIIYKTYFKNFRLNKLIFDRTDTKLSQEKKDTILLTIDNLWSNEEYHKDIEIKINDVSE
jgi:hypothetical protein